jgi:hypothetical protein
MEQVEKLQPASRTIAQRLNKRISLVLKLLIGVGALLLFLDGNYQAGFESLLILAITFLPLLMKKQFQLSIPHEFESLAIIFIYMSLILGEVHGFYARYWWWDLVLHMGSGFLLGILGFLLVFVMNQNERVDMQLSPAFIALFAFMFAMGIGALWEIFEFAMDSTFGMNMQKSGLVDTMWDLIVDCTGALTISLLGYGYLKTEGVDSFLEQMIQRFVESNPDLFRARQ